MGGKKIQNILVGNLSNSNFDPTQLQFMFVSQTKAKWQLVDRRNRGRASSCHHHHLGSSNSNLRAHESARITPEIKVMCCVWFRYASLIVGDVSLYFLRWHKRAYIKTILWSCGVQKWLLDDGVHEDQSFDERGCEAQINAQKIMKGF